MAQTPLRTMKQQAEMALAYCIKFITGGQERTALVLPDGDGSVMSETYDGSGIMQGLLPSGKTIEIPMDCITNVFATWWRVTNNAGKGVDTWNLDDEAIKDYVEASQDKPDRWKNGVLQDTRGQDVTGNDDEPEKGKIRGRRW